MTFDVTPVDDVIVNTGTPANETFEDGETVSLDMAAFFVDPDNDPVIYTAVGLPNGLAIDGTTGEISGQIDPSASLTSPYLVTVSADDQINPVVSTSFEIAVTNTIPVASGDLQVSVTDGDMVLIDLSAEFVDADGDTLSFSISTLPTWLSFDAGTGMLSGVAPSDASVSGPLSLTVTADDGEGGSDQLVLTLTPQNAAPVVVGLAPDMVLQDGDTVSFDVSAHFADGSPDSDPLTFTVTGLPMGVTFDALTGHISGSVSTATDAGVYQIAMTADDGQGGVVSDGFTMRVGDTSFIETVSPFASFDDLVEAEGDPLFDDTDDIIAVSDAVLVDGGLAGLYGDRPVQRVVNGINALPSGADAADAMIDVSGLATRAPGEPFLFADGSSLLDFDNGSFMDVAPGDPRLDAVDLKTTVRPGLLLIELEDRAGDAFVVDQVRLALDGAERWPAWMTMVRDKLIAVRPPEGTDTLKLSLALVFDGGERVLKTVTVDVNSGLVTAIRPAANEADQDAKRVPEEQALPAKSAGDQHPVSAGLSVNDLRGALNE
ncbi:MAG: putative Ig domain-containing protein [Pseudomonadota bacterium]